LDAPGSERLGGGPFGAPCHAAEYTQGASDARAPGAHRLDGLLGFAGLGFANVT